MIAALIGVLVSDIGLIPKQISSFGIVFTEIEQENLLKLIFWVLLYYITTFVIYAASEYSASKLSKSEENIRMTSEKVSKNMVLGFIYPSIKEKHDLQELRSSLLNFFRSIFEFFLPITWGGYSVYAVYQVM